MKGVMKTQNMGPSVVEQWELGISPPASTVLPYPPVSTVLSYPLSIHSSETKSTTSTGAPLDNSGGYAVGRKRYWGVEVAAMNGNSEDSEPEPLSRSLSFGGCRRQDHGGTITSLGSSTSWQNQYSSGVSPVGSRRLPPVLGQQPPTTPRELRRTLSLPPHIKVPKSPRPERSVVVGDAVVKGLREGVNVTVQDLMALRRLKQASHRAMSQGRMYEAEKQMKTVERYQKRLEFHLSQVEDLLDQYNLHQKLRQGARTMAYAYAASPGKERTSALNNVRSGYRECTDTMCALEVQIEHLMGTFSMEIKGIQGFARLCPGDVFEVTLKHGRQKWKSRGRVSRDGAQNWDNGKTVFKATIGEPFTMKAVEVKLLGKSVTIGSRECDTRDLFSPHPQLMTVNLNHAGSLKLNVVVTWNPLDGTQEDSMLRSSNLTSSTSSVSTSGGRVGVFTPPPTSGGSPTPPSLTRLLSRQLASRSIPECAVDNDSSFGSMSARSSNSSGSSNASPLATSSRGNENSRPGSSGGVTADSQDCLSLSSSSMSPSCDISGNFTLVRKKETRTEQWARYSQFSLSSSNGAVDHLSRSYPQLSTHSPLSKEDSTPSSGDAIMLGERSSSSPEYKSGDSSSSSSRPKLSNSLVTLPLKSSFQSLPNASSMTSLPGYDAPSFTPILESEDSTTVSLQPLRDTKLTNFLMRRSPQKSASTIYENGVSFRDFKTQLSAPSTSGMSSQSTSNIPSVKVIPNNDIMASSFHPLLTENPLENSVSESNISPPPIETSEDIKPSVVTDKTVTKDVENKISTKERDAHRWLASADAWDPRNVPCTLPKLLARVVTCLEDVQGQWPSLQNLDEVVKDFCDVCKEPPRRCSMGSQSSLNVEAALGAFDFLDAESDDEAEDGKVKEELNGFGPSTSVNGKLIEESRQYNLFNRNTSSLESKYSIKSNLNSLDSKSSGKSSLTNTLEDKSTQSSEGSKSSDSSTLEDKSRSSGQSSFSNTLEDKSVKSTELSSGTSTLELDLNGPNPSLTVEFVYVQGCIEGSIELQKFFYVHLRRVLRLLQNLGHCGPLRHIERWSEEELVSEGNLLQTIMKHKEQFAALRPHHILSIPHVQVLWDSVSPSSDHWCVTSDCVVKGLHPVVTSLVPPNHTETLPKRVLQRMVEIMSDGHRGSYTGSELITAGHFSVHLKPSLQTTVPALSSAILFCDTLSKQCVDGTIRGLASLKAPEGMHVKALGDLLHAGPPHLVHHVIEYLTNLYNDRSAMQKLLDSCYMELESRVSEERVSACVLLAAVAGLRPCTPPVSETSNYSTLNKDAHLDMSLYITEDACELEDKDGKKKDCNFRRKSNCSSTSTSSSKSTNVDSGIASSPKRSSLISSAESSTSSSESKRQSSLLFSLFSTKQDVMSSSYPSASSLHNVVFGSVGENSSSTRPHSSYHSQPAPPSPPQSPLSPLPHIIEVLSFIQQSDRSSRVQKAARQGLQRLGREGEDALHQWTLSAHGFQGVGVTRNNKSTML